MAPNCTATIAARMSVGRVPDRSRSKANANRDGSAQVCAQGIMTELGYREAADYALYRDLLAERCRKASVACRAYGLMPNHVHLILVPATADGLARAIGETHSTPP